MHHLSHLAKRSIPTLLLVAASAAIAAAQAPHLAGTVTDPSGAVIRNAHIAVLDHGKVVANATTDEAGHYSIDACNACQLRIAAPAFKTEFRAITPASASGGLDIQLVLNPLAQQVTVTASGLPTLQQNTGSAVTVIQQNQFQHFEALGDALSLIPGVQVTQTGQAGGATSLFVRGGASDSTKVLLDGVPVNDIGGTVNLAPLTAFGVERVEVLGGPNGATYGVDAQSGVVSLSTPRGTTRLPQLSYLGEGGNFGTYHQEGTFSGATTLSHAQGPDAQGVDYFADYSRFDTANAIQRDQYHNGTFTGNFGWTINSTTDLRATMHHNMASTALPNATLLYGIADNAHQNDEDSYGGVTLDNQTASRWHNQFRYNLVRLRDLYADYSPTGIYSDDAFAYLGAPVTIKGANGYTVSGQAIFQYPETYPYSYGTLTDRDTVGWQSDYRFNPHMVGLFGFQYQNERGYSYETSENVQRGIYDYTVQLSGDLLHDRLHYVAGSGLEKNQLFGFAATPRVSLAYTLPQHSGAVTKIRASFGKGIKEPAVFDQLDSLFDTLAENGGSSLIAQYNIKPLGAEYSRSYDGGIDHIFADGRSKLSLSLFHTQYTNVVESVPTAGLLALGVPESVAAALPYGSADVNSQAYRAMGIELSGERQLFRDWFLRGGYTYTDAVVQRSFGSYTLGPSYNPSFPTIPIGFYDPLAGARPFRVAPHTGYMGLNYRHRRFSALLTGTFVSRRDDSDFLYDANYGNTLLLPNRNLDPGYQHLNLSLNYNAGHHLQVFTSFQNLLSQEQSEAFGYEGLPFTFRSGMKLTLGGNSWKVKLK